VRRLRRNGGGGEERSNGDLHFDFNSDKDGTYRL
jgi:hypothetical protein